MPPKIKTTNSGLGLISGQCSNSAVRVLIIGCGYVGTPLGAELARLGHEVFGVTRTDRNHATLKSHSIQPLLADVSKRPDLDSLPLPFDWVVNAVSSSKGGIDEYKEVYLQGTRNLIDWLAATPPKKFVYTSSTSVYGQTDGSQVKESSPAEPASETGQVLVAVEKLLLDAAREKRLAAIILRVAGIYGPERGHLFQQYLKDEAVIVRLAYEASTESDELVAKRMKAVDATLASLWTANACRYPLQIEADIVRSVKPAVSAPGVKP